MKIQKMILIVLCLITFNVNAKDVSCKDSFLLASAAASQHLYNPSLNDELATKAAFVFLDLKDPSKIYLLEDEIKEVIEKFNQSRNLVFSNLRKNDCSSFNILDDAIKKGEERWKKLVNGSLQRKDLATAEEVIRDSANLKNFQSEADLKKYSDYFVSRFVSIEQTTYKNKKTSEIVASFKKTFLKENKKKKDTNPLIITRSLFLAMDPHSDYISEEESSNFEMNIKANLQGIGLSLKEDEFGSKVMAVVPNSPAEKSGKIKKGDVIIKINNKKIANMGVDEVVDLIRGKKGTKIDLTLIRKNENSKISSYNVTLIRDIIPLEEQRVKAKDFTENNKRIVVLNLPGFYNDNETGRGSTKDIIDAYNDLKSKGKIDGIILDLRNNGGGLLEESIKLAGLFLKEPIVVQVKSGDNKIQAFQSGEAPIHITEPVVVLTNRFSASASEIVAGALKDYKRALIVGDDRTYGKGTVQAVINKFRTMELGMMKVTTAQFFTPSGSSTQIKGVESDIRIPSASQLSDLGELNQRFAIDWNQVPSQLTETIKINYNVDTLSKKSSDRIKKNKEFEKYSSLDNYRKWLKEQEKINKDDEIGSDLRFDLSKDEILKETINISIDYSSFLSNN